ncbi:hypothetical protein F2P81_019144 [Scophthalmus maximus]|uniref:Uncharacterized protein n=1 Tax=Scophthalmus maximus TaxID=52904 RepID=A0A6A4S4R9_SCOMX|nr:hypothetical protein F2P81_019144 [Scophthalmus maximus]
MRTDNTAARALTVVSRQLRMASCQHCFREVKGAVWRYRTKLLHKSKTPQYDSAHCQISLGSSVVGHSKQDEGNWLHCWRYIWINLSKYFCLFRHSKTLVSSETMSSILCSA